MILTLLCITASCSLVLAKPGFVTSAEPALNETSHDLLVNWKSTLNMRDIWAEIRGICKEKHGLSTKVLLDFESRNNMTKTPELTKFVHCIYKGIGVNDEKNSFHILAMKDLLTDDYYQSLQSCVPSNLNDCTEDTSFDFYYCVVNKIE